MPDFNIIQADLAGQGKTLEIFGEIEQTGDFYSEINFDPQEINPEGEYLLAVSAIGTEENFIPENMSFKLLDPGENVVYDFREAKEPFYFEDNPKPGVWQIRGYSEGTSAFTVNVSFISRVGRFLKGCKACKMALKAVAVAIFAAFASFMGVPAALIAKVALFLGVEQLIAQAFIESLAGNTVDVIAEKLCEKLGRCP